MNHLYKRYVIKLNSSENGNRNMRLESLKLKV